MKTRLSLCRRLAGLEPQRCQKGCSRVFPAYFGSSRPDAGATWTLARLTSCFPPVVVVAAVLLLAPSAPAITTTAASNPNVGIPDNNINGVADTIHLSTAISSITSLTLTLDITGGYNGDFYAYLQHGTGFAVLLNRVGRTAGNTYGFADSGFQVTFDDAAATDIHLASAGAGNPLIGTYQPDGRNVSPFSALDTSPRTAFLSSFNGLDANGGWTLFIADVSPVGLGTLADWSLTVNGNALSGVPDGGGTRVLLGLALAGLAWFSGLRKNSVATDVSRR